MLAFIYGLFVIHAQEEYDNLRGDGSFIQALKYFLLTISLILVIALIAYLVYPHYMVRPENINVEELVKKLK